MAESKQMKTPKITFNNLIGGKMESHFHYNICDCNKINNKIHIYKMDFKSSTESTKLLVKWGTRVHPWRMHVNVWQNQYSIVK